MIAQSLAAAQEQVGDQLKPASIHCLYIGKCKFGVLFLPKSR